MLKTKIEDCAAPIFQWGSLQGKPTSKTDFFLCFVFLNFSPTLEKLFTEKRNLKTKESSQIDANMNQKLFFLYMMGNTFTYFGIFK